MGVFWQSSLPHRFCWFVSTSYLAWWYLSTSRASKEKGSLLSWVRNSQEWVFSPLHVVITTSCIFRLDYWHYLLKFHSISELPVALNWKDKQFILVAELGGYWCQSLHSQLIKARWRCCPCSFSPPLWGTQQGSKSASNLDLRSVTRRSRIWKFSALSFLWYCFPEGIWIACFNFRE